MPRRYLPGSPGVRLRSVGMVQIEIGMDRAEFFCKSFPGETKTDDGSGKLFIDCGGHPIQNFIMKVVFMKITDLIIDNRSMGGKFWLTEVIPAYEYKDGKRTDNLIGYRYMVALPERGLEKIGVKVEGKQLVAAPESGYVDVTFTGLEIFLYWSNGQPQIGARAKAVALVNQKP